MEYTANVERARLDPPFFRSTTISPYAAAPSHNAAISRRYFALQRNNVSEGLGLDPGVPLLNTNIPATFLQSTQTYSSARPPSAFHRSLLSLGGRPLQTTALPAPCGARGLPPRRPRGGLSSTAGISLTSHLARRSQNAEMSRDIVRHLTAPARLHGPPLSSPLPAQCTPSHTPSSSTPPSTSTAFDGHDREIPSMRLDLG